VDCLFGFDGLPFDTASGTNVTPTRRYDPATGRWDSPDTEGFNAGDTNLYRYCGNSPTNATDPNGTEPKVAAAILQALARGDIQLALELLAGIGYKGAALVPAFLQKFRKRPAEHVLDAVVA
jgi:RHS repeat-associated protein